MSGLGAGMDSFYEYLLKVRRQLTHKLLSFNKEKREVIQYVLQSILILLQAYIAFGEVEDLVIFMEMYKNILKYMRKG